MQATSYQIASTRTLPVNLLVILHIILGIFVYIVPETAIVFELLYLIYSLLNITQTRNKNNEAAFTAAYLASLEILIKLSHIGFADEFEKYAIVIVLFWGMYIERSSRKLPSNAILYFCLLLPSIFVGNYVDFHYFRTSVSFNLSGPLSLMISWLYFLDRKFTKTDFRKIILQLILPIIAECTLILLRFPHHFDFSDQTQSSHSLSGGYGPNQVSVTIGFGFFAASLSILLRQKILSSRNFDFLMVFIFLAFNIITYSRGGVITGIASLIAAAFVFIRIGRGSKQFSRTFYGVIFFCVTIYMVWSTVNRFTSNSIAKRYEDIFSESNHGAGQSNHLDIRYAIIIGDLKAFEAHPILGNGPGGASLYRYKIFGDQLAAHTEFTRMLGDHGILGLFSLIILFSSTWRYYKKRNGDNKIIFAGFIAMSFLTMLHNAMRLAIPGLAFGLALIDVNLNDHPLERESSGTQ